MINFDEVKLYKPTANYKIPAGAAREAGRENIERALQDELEAAEAREAEGLMKLAKSAWSRLTGVKIDQADAQAVASDGEPEASR